MHFLNGNFRQLGADWFPLAESIVQYADKNFQGKSVNEIALAKDKKYTLTMNTYSYHYRERNDGASITYPIAVGSIVYHNYVWDSGSAQVYPASTANFYYAGDLSFIYQRTN